jgi:uncharacterized sulfatase
MVEWFDETCGELLGYLDKQGLAENTIVVYVADNGWIQDPKVGKPLKSKLTQYDAGHRTPIMVRWPGKAAPRKSDKPVSSIDLAPTLLCALGLKPAAAMQGVNLLDENAVARRDAVFGECFGHDAVDINEPASSLRYRWVVEGDWRLIVPHPANVKDEQAELYNVVKDPGEEQNLAPREQARVEALRKRLDAWWNPGAK